MFHSAAVSLAPMEPLVCLSRLQVTGKKFVPLAEAPAEVKAMNGGKSELHMQVRA